MSSEIYSITCIPTGKKYIGIGAISEKRRLDHFFKLRAGKHPSKEMNEDFKKYGEDNFLFKIEKTFRCFLRAEAYEKSLIIKFRDIKPGIYNKRSYADGRYHQYRITRKEIKKYAMENDISMALLIDQILQDFLKRNRK